jgi:hypothetical protein
MHHALQLEKDCKDIVLSELRLLFAHLESDKAPLKEAAKIFYTFVSVQIQLTVEDPKADEPGPGGPKVDRT